MERDGLPVLVEGFSLKSPFLQQQIFQPLGPGESWTKRRGNTSHDNDNDDEADDDYRDDDDDEGNGRGRRWRR